MEILIIILLIIIILVIIIGVKLMQSEFYQTRYKIDEWIRINEESKAKLTKFDPDSPYAGINRKYWTNKITPEEE